MRVGGDLVAIQPDVELQDLDGLLLEDHLLPRQELVEARHPQVVKRPPPLLPLLPRQLGLREQAAAGMSAWAPTPGGGRLREPVRASMTPSVPRNSPARKKKLGSGGLELSAALGSYTTRAFALGEIAAPWKNPAPARAPHTETFGQEPCTFLHLGIVCGSTRPRRASRKQDREGACRAGRRGGPVRAFGDFRQ